MGGFNQMMGLPDPASQQQPDTPPDMSAAAPPPNPLAAMGIGQAPPAAIQGAGQNPLDAQEAALQAQLKQQMAVLNAPPQSLMDQNITDLEKYKKKHYDEKFGGGGGAGIAARFLANILSGAATGRTLTDISDKQAEGDWQIAMQQQAQQIAAQKNAAAQAAKITTDQLNDIKNQRTAQYQQTVGAARTESADAAMLKAKTPDVRESNQVMSGAQLKEMGLPTFKTADGTEVPVDDSKYYVPTITKGVGVTNARPTTPPQELRTRVEWAKNPQGQWEAVMLNGKGEITGKVPGLQPPTSITGTVSSRTTYKTAHDLDGNEYYIPVQEGSFSGPANQVPSAVTGAPVGGPGTHATGPGQVPKQAANNPATGLPDWFPAGTIRGGVATTATIKDTRAFARSVTDHVPDIMGLVDKLDKEGKLGPLEGRWNDFLVGKYGEGDPDYAKLRDAVSFLSSAVGRIHGGARGGGSITMIERFDKLASAGRMDASTLKASLGEFANWVDHYQHLGENSPATQGRPRVKIISVN